MLITKITLSNYKAYQNLELAPSRLNVIVGANNSGKSTVLQAIHSIQQGGPRGEGAIRAGKDSAKVSVEISNLDPINIFGFVDSDRVIASLKIARLNSKTVANFRIDGFDARKSERLESMDPPNIPNKEPAHLVVPILSGRKANGYRETVSISDAETVGGGFAMLAAKLARVGSGGHPLHEEYADACKKILGFIVSAIPSNNGQMPGRYLVGGQTLGIQEMGEGVPNIVGMLIEMITATDKVFLIEEPENDLHPEALKALLKIVELKSPENQFFISTHSNIVVSYLGGAKDSKLFEVSQDNQDFPPESRVKEVGNSSRERLGVLKKLGYSFSDLELWDGWLILEESSAERIIRDYLIPWFAPKLARIRTISANGAQKVEPVFEDYNRLVCFAHLEEAYREATRVMVDGDEIGKELIESLRKKYPTWPSERFSTFEHGQFEYYYPSVFEEDVKGVLAIGDRKAKRTAKRDLLERVRAWLDEDPARAKDALAESAKEVISMLQKFENDL